MKLSIHNIIIVFITILSLASILGVIYVILMVNATLIGSMSTVSNASIDADPLMTNYMSTVETGYITNATSLQDKVGLAIDIFGVLMLLILFAMGLPSAYNAYTQRKRSRKL